MSPGGRKAELFARPHNRRQGWMSLGNQLPGIYLSEMDVFKRYIFLLSLKFRYQEKYPENGLTLEKMEKYLKEENMQDTEYTYNNHITSGMYKSVPTKPS